MTVSVIPSAAGVNPASLGYLDAHLNGYITMGKLAGTFTLVCRHGTVVYRSAQGLMDRERNKPMRSDTIVRIYSMSKPITSVALMQLHERGLVQLDDPVDQYIPAWSDLHVRCPSAICFRTNPG